MIEVDFDHKRLARWFDDIAERQIPFASSLALNRTAFDARNRLREDLPKHFTVRSTRTKQGIRVGKSTKKKLEASVGSLDDYMKRQTIGGTKTPGKAGIVAIPSRKMRGPGGKRKTLPSKWPKALIAKDEKKRVRKLSIRPGSAGSLLLYQRKGGKRNPRFDLLYVLAAKAKIPRRWPLEKTVEEVVAKRWHVHQKKALEQAMRSARR